MSDEKYGVPAQSKGDIAHSLVKTGLSAIPYAGGPAAELFSLVIAPSLEKRRVQWMEEVAGGLKAVENATEGFSIEGLKDNERFVSIILNASQSAIRNHQQEKREALRNAVLNVARGSGLAEDTEAIFLSLIDRYTTWHLRILRLFQNPLQLSVAKGIKPDAYNMGSRSQLLEMYYTEMQNQRSFYDVVVADLHRDGMVGVQDLHGMMTGRGMFQGVTREWGDRFLTFITSPV